MILDDVLLLAAPTSRSQAYLQALVAHDMLPGHVVLMGDQRPKPNPSLPVLEPAIVDLLLPRLDEPLLQTCATSGISHETCDARNVNDAAIADIIRSIQPRVVIYSGFGGQIVGKPSSRSDHGSCICTPGIYQRTEAARRCTMRS